jgi:2-oxoglutarate ferredoxin oxidoreductase subunit alpha
METGGGLPPGPATEKGASVQNISLTLAITGAGGAGAISTGEMLLHIAGASGYYGILKKTFSPQIRGGESAAIIRLSDRPVATFDGRIDLLIALDWKNFARFSDEVPVTADTLVIQNGAQGDLPPALADRDDLLTIDATHIAKAVESGWANLVLLGLLTAALRCDKADAETAVLLRLAKHDEAVKSAASRALGAGFALEVPAALGESLSRLCRVPERLATAPKRLLASGNQMAALGALEAGIRFVAAYPITPASDLLEALAKHIEPMGGHLVQAEDELAAINMAIGAGFGGVPAMTATSGPGLALMSEAMGLAVASETGVVVVDVMRGGPSTGIPTKSEQSDFNLAVYGLHGDAPHVVLACNSIADCHFTTAWAAALASQLQTLVIVLSDQFLGQSLQIFPQPERALPQAQVARLGALDDATAYQRYRDTESGISPLAVPGDAGGMYTADGLEHTQNAVPSPKVLEHQRQLDKRLRKLDSFAFGDDWAELHGEIDANPLLIC